MALRGQSQIHVTLVQELINDIEEADFLKLKDFCKAKDYGGYGAGQLEKISSLSDFFSKLQQKRIFKEGDYVKLKQLLTQIGNEDAKERVELAEKNLLAGRWHFGGGLSPHGAAQGSWTPKYPNSHIVQHFPELQSHNSSPYRGYTNAPPPYHSSDAMPSLNSSSSRVSGGYHGNSQFPQNHGAAMPLTSGNQPFNMNLGYSTSGQGLHAAEFAQNSNTNHNQDQIQDDFYRDGPGYILFINNHFQKSQIVAGEVYDRREGAEKDTQSIRLTYEQCLSRHKLQIEEEVGQKRFLEILEAARNEINRSLYSFFMLIISSHGVQTTITENGQTIKKESIVLVDSTQVTVDQIREYFNGTNAPALNGKPKVFIIQACRGLGIGRGVPDLADCAGRPNDAGNPPRQLTRPDNADVLLAYATSEGTKSWRNSVEGTWYLNHLCKAIRDNHSRTTKDHFSDLLTLRVHRQIAGRDANSPDRAKQMPCYLTTLTRKFML